MSNGITVQIAEQVYDLQLITDKITTVEIYDFAVAGDVIPASIFTDGPGNLLVSAAASDPRQLDNMTSPPSDGFVLTWDAAESLKMKFKAAGGSGGSALMTNKSGSSVGIGTVVILDTTNDHAFKTTTVQGDLRAFGVVKDASIGNNADGNIAIGGSIETVKVTGNVAIGQALIASTSAGYAKANGGARQDGFIGFALTAYVGGATGTVLAVLAPEFSRGSAAVVVEGTANIANVGTVALNCGTNSDRLVIAVSVGNKLTGGTVAPTLTAPLIAGAAMTALGAQVANPHHTGLTYSSVQMWYYKNPGTGSLTVTGGSQTNGDYSVTAFIALSGVAASSYLGTRNQNNPTGTNPSVNCTDAIPGDMVLSVLCELQGPPASTTLVTARGTGQTNQYLLSSSEDLFVFDTKTATGSTETTSFTLGSSVKSLIMSVPIRPI